MLQTLQKQLHKINESRKRCLVWQQRPIILGTWEAEAGEFQIQGLPVLQSEVKAASST